MPRIYENIIANFTTYQEFKEVATKTINEIYGRVRPFDIFDFHEVPATETQEAKYVATAYYDDEENVPEAQPEGERVSPESLAAAEAARLSEDDDKRTAEIEAAANSDRIRALVKGCKTISQEDAEMAVTLGISDELYQITETRLENIRIRFNADAILPVDERDDGFFEFAVMKDDTEIASGSMPELEAAEVPGVPVEENEMPEDGNVAISKNAITLAATHNVDLTKVVGIGFEGKITSDDVNKFLDANSVTAPVAENANEHSDEQSNA